MAKLQTKTYDGRRRSPTARLLCCFGVSQKPDKGVLEEEPNQKPIPTVDPFDHRKGKHRITVRLAFLGLRVPKSNLITSAKTVPVFLEKDIKLIHYDSNPKSKSTTDQSSPTTTITGVQTVVPATPDQIPKDKPLQSNKKITDINTPKYGPPQKSKCQIQKRLSFVQRIEAIRCGSSQPNSPKPTRVNSEPTPLIVNRAVMPKKSIERFEPVVGISVVMITLVIMVMWGRLCAILCTSAWLYFVPRLVDSATCAVKYSSNLGSETSKKKVVFEGFLERPKKPLKTVLNFQ